MGTGVGMDGAMPLSSPAATLVHVPTHGTIQWHCFCCAKANWPGSRREEELERGSVVSNGGDVGAHSKGGTVGLALTRDAGIALNRPLCPRKARLPLCQPAQVRPETSTFGEQKPTSTYAAAAAAAAPTGACSCTQYRRRTSRQRDTIAPALPWRRATATCCRH